MTIPIAETTELDENCFINVVGDDGRPKLNIRRSQQNGNGLQVKDDGLFVPDTTAITKYVLIPESRVTVNDSEGTGKRKALYIKADGNGIFNLVFRTSRTGRQRLFTLPASAPLPSFQIATSAGTGMVWIEENSRTIECEGLEANTYYAANMSGFFTLNNRR